jgi:hypothetical protein
VLGPAHVKDSGRRTPRGAIVWRAADGPKPSPAWLTPREAEDRLAQLLASAPRSVTLTEPHTFRQACEEWRRYVEHDRQRSASTLRDYRNTVRLYLLSVMFGIAEPQVRAAVVAAHERAVRQAFAYLENVAAVARRGAGGAESVAGNGLVAAGFCIGRAVPVIPSSTRTSSLRT